MQIKIPIFFRGFWLRDLPACRRQGLEWVALREFPEGIASPSARNSGIPALREGLLAYWLVAIRGLGSRTKSTLRLNFGTKNCCQNLLMLRDLDSNQDTILQRDVSYH